MTAPHPIHPTSLSTSLHCSHQQTNQWDEQTYNAGDKFKVTFSYLQPLAFESGRYALALPSTLPPAALPPGLSANGVLDATIAINSGAPGAVEWRLGRHPARVAAARPGSVALALDRESAWPDCDVVADFAVWRQALTATLHVRPPAGAKGGAGGGGAGDDEDGGGDDGDGRGSFVLMVSPPGELRAAFEACLPAVALPCASLY